AQIRELDINQTDLAVLERTQHQHAVIEDVARCAAGAEIVLGHPDRLVGSGARSPSVANQNAVIDRSIVGIQVPREGADIAPRFQVVHEWRDVRCETASKAQRRRRKNLGRKSFRSQPATELPHNVVNLLRRAPVDPSVRLCQDIDEGGLDALRLPVAELGHHELRVESCIILVYRDRAKEGGRPLLEAEGPGLLNPVDVTLVELPAPFISARRASKIGEVTAIHKRLYMRQLELPVKLAQDGSLLRKRDDDTAAPKWHGFLGRRAAARNVGVVLKQMRVAPDSLLRVPPLDDLPRGGAIYGHRSRDRPRRHLDGEDDDRT